MTILIDLHYFPSLPWFALYAASDHFILNDTEMFTKQTYRNRALIVNANKVMPLIVPVKKGKSRQAISRVTIDFSINWPRNQWQTIRSAYGNAPYFSYYEDRIKALFNPQTDNLFLHNLRIAKTLAELGELKPPALMLKSDALHLKDQATDFTGTIKPDRDFETISPEYKPFKYFQVFSERHGFIKDLSMLDLLMNEGPYSGELLRNCYRNEPPDTKLW